ncbi:MAG: hypothetical protein WAM60_14210, partial [Candidatus Promineifilaceae bacterium]
IWDSQNNEKLFAINEAALHKRIQTKSRSVNHLLNFFEAGMVVVNLIVGVVLIADAIFDNGPNYQYLISVMYFGYSVYAVFRRMRRRKAEVRFDETIVGELDKAMWQLNYHIRQTRSIILWYVLPLTLVVTASFFLAGKPFWALFMLLALIPVSLLGPRWEVNKWYLPKKRELESLREALLAPEAEL